VAMMFLSALGGVGLLLAMSGLYGIVSYAASRRRFEIGVRMALGASRFVIVRLIARDAVMMVGAGSILGGVLSLGLIRALWPLLPGGAGTVAPLALGAVLVVMMIVGVAAALRPALRSASIDPSVALRRD
jgi:ABC-type antimicrobial peptide transport system permease subunit